MNLNDVHLFIQVIEHNSFTSAAEKLGIQKSTISRRIAQLEDELGVRLLNRTTRKLSMTDEGEDLFKRCRPLLEELENVEHSVTSRQSEPKGRLRITMPPELGIFIMNDAVSSFIKRYPQIQIDIELSVRVVDLVEEGIDLALRVGDLSDSSLIARKISDAHAHLYASQDYLNKYGEPETPDDLINHQCIGIKLNSTDWVFENWNEGKPVPVNFRIRANNLTFCKDMLLNGLGIGRIPNGFFEEELKTGEVKQILTEYRTPTVGIHALYPSRRHLNPKVRLFIDHIVETLDQHPWMK